MEENLMVLGDVLRVATGFGNRDAFRDTARAVSFISFEKRVKTLIDALKKRGLSPGDRIAVLSLNSVSAVECIAAASAGFILVPLNWRLTLTELNALIRNCSPRAIFCDETHRPLVAEGLLDSVDVVLKVALEGPAASGWVDYETLIEEGICVDQSHSPDPADPALIIYTSGTTGAPKGVAISHRALVSNIQQSAAFIVGAGEQDRSLLVMPMFHVRGLCFYLLPNYLAGATTVLRPFFELNQLVKTLREEAITNIHLVPTMISDLEAHPSARESTKTLRRIMYAGSTMPAGLLARAMSTFSDCSFVQAYGSTEGGVISTLGSSEHELAVTQETQRQLLKSCGHPVPDSNVRVIRDDDTQCDAGEIGEITVQNPGVMQGYWDQPKLSSSAFVDGYFRTGDVGYFDTDGYLYLVDRKNDMIVTGGENVFPTEVENVFYQCPEIVEAAVFGVPDAKWIEKVVAAVTLREESCWTEAEIIAFARQRLAGYKCPKNVLILSQLPRTGAGKISKKNLRTEYSEREYAKKNLAH